MILDRHYTMSQQASKIIQSSTYKLRLINVISTMLTKPVAERVVNVMVTSNLEYCDFVLYGISGHQLWRIQRIQNIAAILILQRDRWSSARVMLNELHWLLMRKRISFKVLLLLYKAVHGLTPDYITIISLCSTAPSQISKQQSSGCPENSTSLWLYNVYKLQQRKCRINYLL